MVEIVEYEQILRYLNENLYFFHLMSLDVTKVSLDISKSIHIWQYKL